MKNLPLILLISLPMIHACKEHHHDDPEPESVSVQIYKPLVAAEYDKGDTVFIEARITSPASLHGYELKLTRLADTMLMMDYEGHGHLTLYDIDTFWVNDGSVHSEMELQIDAIVDHSGGKVTKKVQFHAHDQ